MARSSQVSGRGASQYVPVLDRSRSRLRLPAELLPEALRQASKEGLASPIATVRLETGGIIVDGELDPLAEVMLQVIAAASMMVAVDVQAHRDTSLTTIWATPNRAVLTSSLDLELVDIKPVRLARLPEILSDIILLRPPESTGEAPIVVSTATMAAADAVRADPDEARHALIEAGLGPDEIELVLAFQSPATRRWRISSTWAIEAGQQMAELRGLDAGAAGQWSIEMTGDRHGDGKLTFTPQGDGDVMGSLRQILPRRWVGRPLNPSARSDSR